MSCFFILIFKKMDKILILNKIKDFYKCKNVAEFARFLDIPAQNLRNWYTRNTFDALTLITKAIDFNSDWIMTGEGEMLKSEQKTDNITKTETSNETVTMPREVFEQINKLTETVLSQQRTIESLASQNKKSTRKQEDLSMCADTERPGYNK